MSEVPIWIDHAPLFGCVVVVALAALRFFYVSKDQKRCELMILVALFAIPFAIVSQLIVVTLSYVRPWKYDDLAFHIDGLLGFQPSFAAGQLLSRAHWLLTASAFVYNAIPLGPVIIFGAYLWLRSIPEAFTALRVMIIAAVAAVPVYILMPVSGPIYAFAGFPFIVPAHVPWLQSIRIDAPPNAVPSVHFALALLVAWYARHWLAGKILGAGFVLFTMLGTLGLGEHYAIDLVAAVPYALVIWKLASPRTVASRTEQDETVPVEQLIQSMKRPKLDTSPGASSFSDGTQQQQLWTPTFACPMPTGASSGSSSHASGEVTGGAGGSGVRKERGNCGELSGYKR
jgi:hypothetical protein